MSGPAPTHNRRDALVSAFLWTNSTTDSFPEWFTSRAGIWPRKGGVMLYPLGNFGDGPGDYSTIPHIALKNRDAIVCVDQGDWVILHADGSLGGASTEEFSRVYVGAEE